jgi:hypothetical protein
MGILTDAVRAGNNGGNKNNNAPSMMEYTSKMQVLASKRDQVINDAANVISEYMLHSRNKNPQLVKKDIDSLLLGFPESDHKDILMMAVILTGIK